MLNRLSTAALSASSGLRKAIMISRNATTTTTPMMTGSWPVTCWSNSVCRACWPVTYPW